MKITRRINWSTEKCIRRFRCFNINHYIDNETASEIVDEILAKMDFVENDLESEDRVPGEVYAELQDIVLLAKSNQLKRMIPEVIIEVKGKIKDSEIENLINNELSEATGWLHDGFEFEEITKNSKMKLKNKTMVE